MLFAVCVFFLQTYPSLFELYCNGFLPAHINIVGFARSNLTEEAFRESIHPFFKGRGSECDAGVFLAKCHYVSGLPKLPHCIKYLLVQNVYFFFFISSGQEGGD